MRDLFPDFYDPTETEFAKAWKEAHFVLDANVLCQFFEVAPVGRNDLFVILELLGDRVFVPHHAALEYQRNWQSASVKKLNQVTGALRGILQSSNLAELSKNFPLTSPELSGLVTRLNDASDAIVRAVTEEANQTRARLDNLLAGRVGPAISLEEVTEFSTQAAERFKKNAPPGCGDKAKGEARVTWEGRELRLQYGDVYLWKQIIAYAEQCGKPIIFIQNERKDDWYRHGRPRVELREEMRRARVPFYWQYASDDFVREAGKYLEGFKGADSADKLQVSPEPSTRGLTLDDLRDLVARKRTLRRPERATPASLSRREYLEPLEDLEMGDLMELVRRGLPLPDGYDHWNLHLASEGRSE